MAQGRKRVAASLAVAASVSVSALEWGQRSIGTARTLGGTLGSQEVRGQ